MFRREIFSPHGASPLAACDVVGTTRRVKDERHSFVLEMKEGSPPTRLTRPKKGGTPLGLRHRFVMVTVRTDPAKPFAIELGVRDTSRLQRTLTVASGCQVSRVAQPNQTPCASGKEAHPVLRLARLHCGRPGAGAGQGRWREGQTPSDHAAAAGCRSGGGGA